MLVLSRKPNQSIMIGHDVVVTVLEIRGDQVRLGIKAPRSVDVHREEVYLELQKANQAAAASKPPADASVLERLNALAKAKPPKAD